MLRGEESAQEGLTALPTIYKQQISFLIVHLK